MTAQYNNLDSVREVFAANKGEIAGVILEPVVGNSGYIAPTKEFLQVRPFSFLVEKKSYSRTRIREPLYREAACVSFLYLSPFVHPHIAYGRLL